MGSEYYEVNPFEYIGRGPVVVKLTAEVEGLQKRSWIDRLARLSYLHSIEAHSSKKLALLGSKVAKVLFCDRFRKSGNRSSLALPGIVQE